MRDMQKILFSLLVLILTASAFAQNKSKTKGSGELSINYMMTGSYIAGTSVPDQGAIGGFGASGNYPKKIDAIDNFPQSSLTLIAQTERKTPYGQDHTGFKLLLVNTSGEEKWFSAVDSHLDIIQEAQDKDGTWKAIEAFPASWCGNSFHRVRIGTDEYWEFTAPRYAGTFKTKLRFRLGKIEKTAIYSNEFEGSVNAGQFVKRKTRFS